MTTRLVLAVNAPAREAGHDAATLVKELLGGRGGGSAEIAQGGGIPAADLTALLADLPRRVTVG
ncbi:DHHA1 domain-containing protein [Streptomyces sp. Je 1-79]|uniref:DHHA1 domain-containing protein n=1 Tax=Streptomyces sp. Je 1-79 TaxID=2943847 RepID=UPI0021A6308E|nr:DHHA1 domain-containing protein [Streptomyces sp. Je 1-79]MCT4357040.1 DHHA1 domain-containing protein [Streptomyces sp. Je 1-79]